MTVQDYIKNYDSQSWDKIYKAILNYYWPECKHLKVDMGIDLPKDVCRVIISYYKEKAKEWFFSGNIELNGKSVFEVYQSLTDKEAQMFLKSFLTASFERVMYLK